MMSNRKTFKFEHRSCTLIVVVTKLQGEWSSYFDLAFPLDANQPTLWGENGPYRSADEAFEKAKQWAVPEIEQRMEKASTPDSDMLT
jgi:hypothetical protein